MFHNGGVINGRRVPRISRFTQRWDAFRDTHGPVLVKVAEERLDQHFSTLASWRCVDFNTWIKHIWTKIWYPLWMGSLVSEQSQVNWSCHSHHSWRTPSWRTTFLTQSQVSYQWDRKCGPASAGPWDEVQLLPKPKKAEVEMGLETKPQWGKVGEDKVKRRQDHHFSTSERLRWSSCALCWDSTAHLVSSGLFSLSVYGEGEI